MSDTDTLLLGAVAYDPKVVTIWEGFKAYFSRRGLAFDFVLFSNSSGRSSRTWPDTSTSRGTRRSRGSERAGSPPPAARTWKASP